MRSIARLKTLISVLLLSVIATPALHADEDAPPPQLYRFGDWLLVVPADVRPEVLVPGPYEMPVPAAGIELLAYWQDGSQRAVSLRYDALLPKQDLAVLKSFRSSSRIKGCDYGGPGKVKTLKSALRKTGLQATDAIAFPEDGALLLAGTERGLHRVGDVLVADLGNSRVQLTDDSPVVRVGDWGSGKPCRFEFEIELTNDPED